MFQKKAWLLLWFSIVTFTFQAQKQASSSADGTPATTPKLVVGVVVDQMRYDYLTRFWDHFGEGGFKRLVKEGFLGKNHHFNYAPTSTGPGHASVYTGATPSVHGIIGNSWFDKESGTMVYCAGDESVQSVGTSTGAGQMSPHRLIVSTITDELRLHTQMKAKVIAISLKDRGSVLPGGHTANAAYWFAGGAEGNWVSSSYYMQQLPQWVSAFNASRDVDKYRKVWDTDRNISSYVQSGPDNNAFERGFEGRETPQFPYDLPALWNANGEYDLLKDTPYGNNMTTDFSLLALKEESLGKDNITDFLAISYSSTDYIGHRFGVNSKEVQDVYVRLDGELERLLSTLDKEVGKNEYTLFLTADHGAMHVAAYLTENRIPAGSEESIASNPDFKEFISFTYGDSGLIREISNHQIFLDHRLLNSLELNLHEVQDRLAEELLSYEGVSQTYTAYQMKQEDFSGGIPALLQKGYNQKRSGDVLWVPAPGYANYGPQGSTHGSPQVYDTHVPLLLFGKGVKQGSTTTRTEIPDIAPTLSVLMGISFPNGTNGKPISVALE